MSKIRVFHLSDRATIDQRADAMMAFNEAEHGNRCVRMWWAGLYDEVAEVETSNLDLAYELTNHIDQSWPDNTGVTAFRENPKSTSVGDVLAHPDGKVYLVASMGFMQMFVDAPAERKPVAPESR